MRRLLGGHVGVADSLGAAAITSAGYSEPAAAVAAVAAGADMVMVDASWWYPTLVPLEQATASGTLPLSRVNAAVDTVLATRVCGA